MKYLIKDHLQDHFLSILTDKKRSHLTFLDITEHIPTQFYSNTLKPITAALKMILPIISAHKALFFKQSENTETITIGRHNTC